MAATGDRFLNCLFCWIWVSWWSFCWHWWSQELMVILLILQKSNLTLQQNSHRPVKVSTNSELYPDYFRLPTFLDCSGIQFFDSPPQHSQLRYPWLPASHCVAPVWLTEYHTMLAVTRCFPPNPYLGKENPPR